MHETQKRAAGALPILPEPHDLEYIPVCKDPFRRLYVPDMPEKASVVRNVHERIERQSSLFEVMDKLGSVIGFTACLGMAYLLIRMSYGILW